MSEILVDIDIYHTSVKFVVVKSMKNKVIPKEYQQGFGAITTWGLCDKELFQVTIYCSKKDITFGLVVHELQHATNCILNHIGITPSYENDEAQAYLIGYISNKVFDFIKENKLL